MGDASVFIRKMVRGGRPRYYVIAAVLVDGRWRQRSMGGFDRRRDAEARRREVERHLEALGPAVEGERLTVAEWCATWLAAGNWRPKTKAFYEDNLRRLVLPHLGRRRLRGLRRSHVQAWLAALRDQGCSTATVAAAHRTLRAALTKAVRDGVIAANPAAALGVPRPPSRANAAWSADQLAAFLATARESRWYALLRFLAATGARVGEAAGLTWDRLDLEAGSATIDRTIVWVRGAPMWSEPKTARGRRRVELDPATVEALRAWRRQQAAERLAGGGSWGGAWRDAGLVFCSEDGRPVDASNLRLVMQRIARRVGLPDDLAVSPHALRHTVATLALTSGKPPALVAASLGHDPAVLLSTYAHARADEAGLAATIAALVDGPEGRR